MRGLYLEEITEGSTVCLVPAFQRIKGPGSSKMPVFYNPNMEFARDVTVSLLSAVLDKRRKLKVLDGMAATGIRGIRVKNEVSKRFEVTLNDINPLAVRLIKKNLELNNLEAEVECRNLNEILASSAYDYIDVDPFGSPVEYLDLAVQSIKRHGIIGVSTTDTSVLCGTVPKACVRRYLARSRNNYMCHEAGLRIFLGYVARTAAKFDRAIKPLVCFYADHYFRIFVRVENGAGRADECLANLGYLLVNERNGEVRTLLSPEREAIGPLWLGRLFDADILAKMVVRENFNTGRRFTRILEIWREECDAEPFFYDTNELGKIFHLSPPPLEKLTSALRMLGYRTVRTHISPNGFRTNATISHIKTIYEMLNMK
ncbi:MAG: tRNA (guanine(10)-N(2))-dimethyltransferase [Thermoplasmata archaeon]|nr:tRNA (guanine(10)-N(2))-dimethyltransferase [Thermoplasmata archaeon]